MIVRCPLWMIPPGTCPTLVLLRKPKAACLSAPLISQWVPYRRIAGPSGRLPGMVSSPLLFQAGMVPPSSQIFPELLPDLFLQVVRSLKRCFLVCRPS